VASLSQGRTAAALCGFFKHKSVPVIFEPPCTKNSQHLIASYGCCSVYGKSKNKYLIYNIPHRYNFQNIYTVYYLLFAPNRCALDIFLGSKSEHKSDSDKLLGSSFTPVKQFLWSATYVTFLLSWQEADSYGNGM